MSLFTNLATYDPRTVETDYVERVSRMIPRDGYIDINVADQLATRFLECADRITDEIARCSAYVGRCEAKRREAKANAIDMRISGNGVQKVAATVASNLYGEDPDYKKAHEQQALGEAFLDWLKTKHRNLMSAHVLCKDLMKAHQQTRDQGGWNALHPHDQDEYEDGDIRVTKSDDNADDTLQGSPGVDEW